MEQNHQAEESTAAAMSPRRSARRSLFFASPETPPNTTAIPQETQDMPGIEEEEEGESKPSQRPRAGDPASPSPASTNDLTDAAAGEKKKPKPPFVRVWSAADEVLILECLAEYVKASGSLPSRAQLPHVLAGRLVDKTEFTLIEIYEKVRRLRTRFHNHAVAGAPHSGADGEELRKYELSKQIWGNSPLPPPKRANKEDCSDEAQDTHVRRGFEELQRLYPHLAAAVEQISTANHGYHLKRAFELIDDGKAGKLDAKVKKQRLLEVKTKLNRDDVRNQVLSTLIRYVD